jgi:hypothetical protein
MVFGDRSMPPDTPGTGPVVFPVCPYPPSVARGPGVRWRVVRVARDPHVAGMPGC